MDISELENIEEFDWDEGNINKNELKHGVNKKECEQVFKKKFVVILDKEHSQTEERYSVYGKSAKNRNLFLTITIRGNKVRVISARDQSRKEKERYEKAIEKNTTL